MVFVHGEPTWSFLWRKVLVPVRDAGYRCIAPDLPGFGRSDKPTDIGWYTYDRHTAALSALLESSTCATRRSSCTTGAARSACGAGRRGPDRIGRLVVLDTGLFTGQQRMTEAWSAFRDFVARTDDLPVGFLVRGGVHAGPRRRGDRRLRAPVSRPAAKAGARAFPLILPTAPEAPGAAGGRRDA